MSGNPSKSRKESNSSVGISVTPITAEMENFVIRNYAGLSSNMGKVGTNRSYAEVQQSSVERIKHMSIAPSKRSSDPYAGLAWTASVAILALEKLRKGKEINAAESTALASLGQELRMLSDAAQTPVGDRRVKPLPSHLRSTFFTLVAEDEPDLPPATLLQLREAGDSLQRIQSALATSNLDGWNVSTVESTQDTCLKLLEHLNKQRLSLTVL
jgi:hypothetical protein